MQGFRIMRKGCHGYLYAVEVVAFAEPNLSEIHIVNEFSEVFKDVLGLPPDWEIKFTFDLVIGITPISKAPYRMGPLELVELKVQL